MPTEDPSRTLVLRRSGGGPLAVSTALAIGLAVLGAVRTPQMPWLTFLMTVVSALAVGAWLRMRIEVRPDGLAFRGLRATRLVPWSAVLAAYRSGKGIAVIHSGDRVAVLPGRLRPFSGTLSTDEILALLQRRIEEHGPGPDEGLAEPERIERRTSGRGTLIAVFGAAGAFAVGAAAAGALGGGPVPAALAAVPAVVLGVVGALLARSVTVIDAEGVHDRGVFGMTFIPWSDVKAVELDGEGPARTVRLVRHSGGAVDLPALSGGRGPEGLEPDELVDLMRRRGLGGGD